MKNPSFSLTKETIKIFWRFTKPEWPLLLLAFISLAATSVLYAYIPFVYKDLLDTLALGVSPEVVDKLEKIILWLSIVLVVTIVVRRLQNLAALLFQPRVKSKLMQYCYAYLHEHSVAFFSNNFAGSLVRRVNRYDRAYEDLTDQVIFNLGQTAIRIAVIVIAAGFRSWMFALAIAVWVVIYATIGFLYARHKMKYDLEVAEQDSKITGFMSDTVGNILNVKTFGGLKGEKEEFAQLAEEQKRRWQSSWRAGLQIDLIQGLQTIGLEIVLVYIAFVLWQSGKVTVGDFALLVSYLSMLNGRLWDFGRNVRNIYRAFADANEMTEILLTPHEVTDVKDAKRLRVTHGGIEFKKVTFAYHDTASVFKDFNLHIRPGERVALVGPSGGGKSTIVKMLLRFFDINNGEILIDGQDIAAVTQESLRGSIGLVPQEPVLFHRTLYENILYARPDATKQEVLEAAKLAHCHEFISSFPDGYATYVGERGVKLSGGERQRVAIARAILKNAPILILDEATSSLDSESEHLIQDAMKTLMKGKTVIVIAHRLSTIMQMDRIVVLDGGKVIEEGKHEELVKAKQGTYQRLWEIQAGGFA